MSRLGVLCLGSVCCVSARMCCVSARMCCVSARCVASRIDVLCLGPDVLCLGSMCCVSTRVCCVLARCVASRLDVLCLGSMCCLGPVLASAVPQRDDSRLTVAAAGVTETQPQIATGRGRTGCVPCIRLRLTVAPAGNGEQQQTQPGRQPLCAARDGPTQPSARDGV